jgi:hypothetical protein
MTVTERTGSPYKDFPKMKRTYMCQYNGGNETLFVCPLCAALCTYEGIYTHVAYHEARKEAIPQ